MLHGWDPPGEPGCRSLLGKGQKSTVSATTYRPVNPAVLTNSGQVPLGCLCMALVQPTLEEVKFFSVSSLKGVRLVTLQHHVVIYEVYAQELHSPATF